MTPTPSRNRAVLVLGALAVLTAALLSWLPTAEADPAPPLNSPSPSTPTGGYWMAEANGNVYGFGDAHPLNPPVRDSIVAMAGLPNGGYLLLSPDGIVTARGTPYLGSATLGDDVATTIAALPDGSGYWVFTRRGGAHPFGAARYFGDMTATPLNGGIIASAVTPSGQGYWMVGSDGGIFSFGDARFYGSTGNLTLNQPVVGIAPDPDGVGYWLVAADGGIFAFEASFRGSIPGVLGDVRLNRPVIGALAYGNGYLMVASDGGIFSFSNLAFLGSLGASPPPNPIVAVAVRPPGGGGPITTTTTQPGTTTTEPGTTTTQPGTTTTTTTTTTTIPPDPGPTPTLALAQVGTGALDVTWSDTVHVTNLARTGADGGWNTDMDGFGGVPADSQTSRKFQFTALAVGSYTVTMTYLDGVGATQTTSSSIDIKAPEPAPAPPPIPVAHGAILSAKLDFLWPVGTPLPDHFEYNATYPCGRHCPLPPQTTGWLRLPASAIVDLTATGARTYSFQLRSCTSDQRCSFTLGSSNVTEVYSALVAPTITTTVSGQDITWDWSIREGSDVIGTGTPNAPQILLFVINVDGGPDIPIGASHFGLWQLGGFPAGPGYNNGTARGSYTQVFGTKTEHTLTVRARTEQWTGTFYSPPASASATTQ